MAKRVLPRPVLVLLALMLASCGGGDSTPPIASLTPSAPSPGPSGDDPLYPDQWHLRNSAVVGEDINVEPVWSSGTKGGGVLLVVVCCWWWWMTGWRSATKI